MNNKGFTLVELLCVIVILALITTLASTGIMSISKSSKENIYCAKLEMIEASAKDYGTTHEPELNNSTVYYNNYKSITITVEDLVTSGLLEYDSDATVINPIDDTSLNQEEVIIYLKNNQINVYIDDNNICEN